MNYQTHRVIFNKSRGCHMVVGENARSSGGHGCSGARRSRRNKRQSGQGQTSQTANQTQINGQMVIGQGIQTKVQIPEGALKDQIMQLASQPGQGYMAELASNPQVNWEQIKLVHDQWQYSQQGLTGAGAALLAIVVAVASGGTASSLAAQIGATGTTATAVAAGFSALASSAAVSLVNNGGDLGKTLKELGSSQSLKNIALAMVSAGVLSELNAGLGLDKVTVNDGFTANLNKAVINNMVNATMTSALTGASLEDSLKTGLMSAVISAGAGQAANTIGAMTQDSPAVKALAHALAGCVAGAAGTGNSQGCQSGAIGAVVGELAAQWVNPDGLKSNGETLEFVRVVSAVAGAITGDGSAQSVNTAVMTGVNAAENNYLSHLERKQLNTAQKTCLGTGDATACSTASALKYKDELSDKLLANAVATCKGSECTAVSNFAQKEMAAVGCTAPNSCPDYATLSSFWQVAQGKAQGLEPVYPEGWLLDAKAVLDLGKLGVKAVTGSTGKSSLDALQQLRQVDQATALKVVVENNLYKDWPVAADAVSYRVNQLASFATHNPNASTVVLGKYVPDSAVSYEQVAKAQGATYFELPGQSWDNAVGQLGTSKMWDINKKFLDDQITQGKSFVFTVDPRKLDAAKFTYMEFDYLTKNGYKLFDDGGVYRAVKK